MPGFTSECISGLHQACPDKTCRCPCHPWTQELLNQPVKKSDPTGGVRRELPPELKNLVPSTPQLQNTCPKCQRTWKSTDVFCRQDGSRLVMGKQCLGCGAPQQPEDEFCWQCGLKAGQKPAPSPEPQPEEDTITRLQRQVANWREARDKNQPPLPEGLLKETTV